ncbi:hypothetical protein L596_015622 [Steinernema carpocapsae]|uniref:Uncharacterized protein n=1 Tax=Steinernema carpocapsae TaxID=34508 RepID=A0A4U5NFP5_STECR|nr:hypothetical protein L596_015622 [Steinernema carpocapsae]
MDAEISFIPAAEAAASPIVEEPVAKVEAVKEEENAEQVVEINNNQEGKFACILTVLLRTRKKALLTSQRPRFPRKLTTMWTFPASQRFKRPRRHPAHGSSPLFASSKHPRSSI